MNNEFVLGVAVGVIVMTLVIGLFFQKKRKPDKPRVKWETSTVQCDICNNRWIAVRPAGVEFLECPHCQNMSSYENV